MKGLPTFTIALLTFVGTAHALPEEKPTRLPTPRRPEWSMGAKPAEAAACCDPDCSTTNAACTTPFPGYLTTPTITPCAAGSSICATSECVATGPTWTPTATPTTATSTPPSWTGSASLLAYYTFDSSITNPDSGSCGSDCNLTNESSGVTTSATHEQGTNSDQFSGSVNLYCNMGTTPNCGAMNLPVANFTVMSWAYNTTSADATIMEAWDQIAGNTGYRLSRQNSFTHVVFQLGNGASTVTLNGATNGFPTSTWVHAAATYVSATHTGQVYTDGVPATADTAGTYAQPGTGSFHRFTVGGTTGVQITGFVDATAVWSGALTTDSICRITNCDIDGSLCTCAAGGATYSNTGRGLCTVNTTNLRCDASAPAFQ